MKLLKKILCGILSATMLITSAAIHAMAKNDIRVNLNDKALSFDVLPQIINERTMVPLRAIFEALGASVDWNQETKTIISTKGNTTIKLTINSNIMYVNDNPITLDTPACVIDDRTLVPVRAISEAFDCYVSWNGEQQTVLIYSENTDFYQIKELILEYLYGEKKILESYLNILIDVNNALKEGHDYYGVTVIDRNSININNDERFSSAKNNLFQIYNKVFQYDTSKLPSELTEVMRHVKNSAESIKDFADELSLEVSFDDLSKIYENVNNAENEMNIAINLLTNEAARRNIIINIE